MRRWRSYTHGGGILGVPPLVPVAITTCLVRTCRVSRPRRTVSSQVCESSSKCVSSGTVAESHQTFRSIASTYASSQLASLPAGVKTGH